MLLVADQHGKERGRSALYSSRPMNQSFQPVAILARVTCFHLSLKLGFRLKRHRQRFFPTISLNLRRLIENLAYELGTRINTMPEFFRNHRDVRYKDIHA